MDHAARLLEALSLARADPLAAEALCQGVLADTPRHGLALHLAGVLALQANRLGEALDLLSRAASARPESATTHRALAEATLRAGDPASAARILGGLVADQPRDAALRVALAAALLRAEEPESALAAARAARATDPDAAAPLVAIGVSLCALGRAAEAWPVLVEAVRRVPGDPDAHAGLGNALAALDCWADAERHLRRALSLDPTNADAWASLGHLLTGADRLDEAEAACSRAIALRPDFAQAYWNRSFARLRAQDLVGGWADYEWRRRHPRLMRDGIRLPGPGWQGECLAGRHLLVLASQGFGDTLQMARFLPMVAARGARVTLACDRRLCTLLAQLPVSAVDRAGTLPSHDLWVDQMSLPRLLGITSDAIPCRGGYLTAPAGDRDGIPPGTLRIGIVCAGNPAHSNDLRRSMPPADLAALRLLPDVRLVSLQVGPAAAALAAVLGVPDNAALLLDFAATARLIGTLDLVISVDTSVAHLAGALGVPVWVMLPAAPDWRWPAGRTDSAWYASLRVFRQSRPGDWRGVVGRVVDALRRGA